MSTEMCPQRQRDIDQGWAWWVLLASYINLLLCSGLAYVAGMFQVVFLQEFGGSVALTSWVTALFSSFMQLGGPLSSTMANSFSCRTAVMVGGVCLAVGLATSALAESLGLLFVFFGVIAGAGLGLTYTASIVVINYYFERRRTMVTGLALSSSGLGIMLSPQISTFLFNNFSWREALGMMSAVAAQVCVLGAVMFPTHEKKGNVCSNMSHGCLSWFEKRKYQHNDLSGEGDYNVCLVKRGGNGTSGTACQIDGTKITKSNSNNHSNTKEPTTIFKKETKVAENGYSSHLSLTSQTGNADSNGDKNVSAIIEKSPLTTPHENTDYTMNELDPISENVANSVRVHENNTPNGLDLNHHNKPFAEHETCPNSLQECVQQTPRRYQHHRYYIKHYNRHIPTVTNREVKGNNSNHLLHKDGKNSNNLIKEGLKCQSHYELTSERSEKKIIGEIFQSNTDIHASKAKNNFKHPDFGFGSNTDNSHSKRAFHIHDRPYNHSYSEMQQTHISSIMNGSSERFGMAANGSIKKLSSRCSGINSLTNGSIASSSHYHVTVVPHNPSLMSLVASNKHMDVFLRSNLNHNGSCKVQNELLPYDHLLHRGLFNKESKSKLHSMQSISVTSLKSSASRPYQNGSRHTLQENKSHAKIPHTAVDKLKSMHIFSSTSIMDEDNASVLPSHLDADVRVYPPLYRNTAFIVLCVQLFVANCACGVFNIHLPSFAMSKGLTNQEMTNMLSLNGLALLNGRMLVGAFASATGLDLLIYWALHIIGGLFMILYPVVGNSYLMFCLIIFGIGTFYGSVYSVLTSLTLKYVSLSDLATSFGVEMISAGLGYLLAPPVAGILVDLTGSYDYNMYCGGGLLILSALILMLLPVIAPEVTREDLHKFLAEDATLNGGLGGVEVDIEVEECIDCDDDNDDDGEDECNDGDICSSDNDEKC